MGYGLTTTWRRAYKSAPSHPRAVRLYSGGRIFILSNNNKNTISKRTISEQKSKPNAAKKAAHQQRKNRKNHDQTASKQRTKKRQHCRNGAGTGCSGAKTGYNGVEIDRNGAKTDYLLKVKELLPIKTCFGVALNWGAPHWYCGTNT